MAKLSSPKVDYTEDANELVYVSDVEDMEEPIPASEPGMRLEIKNLYHVETDVLGHIITTDKLPKDMPEPEETLETARYALLIRYHRSYDGRKGVSIASIVVQSPLLKKVLCWVLKDYPCIAPELNRLELISPFRPFVHRWQRLTDALNNERDPLAKSHIQLFYDALKKELQVTLETRADFLAHGTITFNSLWMIFEPGDIMYTVLNKRPVAARLATTSIVQGPQEDSYRLECDMVHGDGHMFGWSSARIDLPQFNGMTKITDLASFPLKYHPKADELRNQLIKRGRAYENLMGFHHKMYKGIALYHDRSFPVDSRIIVDPDAYRCYDTDYDLHLKPLKTISADSSMNLAAADDLYDEDESSNGEAKKRALPALSEDQLLLCTSSVKGYSLRNKRWLDLFIDCIEDIEWNDAAWDNVVLEHDLKDLIISMTRGHRQRHRGLQPKGLNILLSGCTGVGKTFAVESVAEALHAPLFHVTPADVDLGAKDPDLQSPFTETLEMCGKWNVILLFDQAQGALDSDPLDDDQRREYSRELFPFAPKRTLYPDHSFSVLLDALGSHSALFFATWNLDAGDCMDDRLQSRFHVCLQLPWPTRASRAQIWQKCLGSHKDMSFFIDSNALAGWDLNGLEIANA
ncbi:MAG: hypothetical protein Q9207_006549, partial [Kuettlingeria erythrocarpa]